jgi:hypothetical protein
MLSSPDLISISMLHFLCLLFSNRPVVLTLQAFISLFLEVIFPVCPIIYLIYNFMLQLDFNCHLSDCISVPPVLYKTILSFIDIPILWSPASFLQSFNNIQLLRVGVPASSGRPYWKTRCFRTYSIQKDFLLRPSISLMTSWRSFHIYTHRFK